MMYPIWPNHLTIITRKKTNLTYIPPPPHMPSCDRLQTKIRIFSHPAFPSSLNHSLYTGTRAGIPVNEVCYNAAMLACGNAGAWQRALELLRGMRAAGVEPDISCYQVAIHVCGKCGRWEESVEVLREAAQNGLVVDSRTYATAIKACGLNKQWEAALALFREMPQIGIETDTAAYSAIIR